MPGIRDKHRRTFIGLFTGEEFVLRKIPASEFMEHLGMVAAENTDTLSKQLKALGDKLQEKSLEPEGGKDILRFYLEHGVRSPKIFFGPYDECPEDQIHVEDLSDDGTSLVQAISDYSFDFSGFKKKMGAVLQGQLPATPGLGGEEVQQTANGAAPERDGS